jgi:uncharacterized damage-inducible protein DinB
MRITRIVLPAALYAATMLAAPPSLLAQATDNPFTGIVKSSWDSVKKNVSASATAMPENEYSFQPTPEVRSFAKIVGHLANEHYMMCSTAKGEKDPNTVDFEKTNAKADLLKALTASIAYCDGVFAGMTDAKAFDTVEMFGSKFKRLGALELNVTHDSEHYGNLVTYMRMKGHVPPSSAGGR